MLPPRFLPAFLTPRFGRCLSLEMLRDGWAVTYEQAGAVYGKWGKEHFLELEAKAKLVVYPTSLYFSRVSWYTYIHTETGRRVAGSGPRVRRTSLLRSINDDTPLVPRRRRQSSLLRTRKLREGRRRSVGGSSGSGGDNQQM